MRFRQAFLLFGMLGYIATICLQATAFLETMSFQDSTRATLKLTLLPFLVSMAISYFFLARKLTHSNDRKERILWTVFSAELVVIMTSFMISFFNLYGGAQFSLKNFVAYFLVSVIAGTPGALVFGFLLARTKFVKSE